MIPQLTRLTALFALVGLASAGAAENFRRLSYHHPGLQVDLGLGLWGAPVVFDYDGDGREDLLMNSSGPQFNGLFWFQRDAAAKPFDAFAPPRKLGPGHRGLRVSRDTNGKTVVMTPGKVHPDFRRRLLKGGKAIDFTPDFYVGKQSQWQLADLDGDGRSDLVIGVNDTRDYGWIAAQGAFKRSFDDQGRWLHGALRGHVYWARNLGTEDAPRYAPAVRLMAGGQPMEVTGRPAPCAADFDGDGLIDLVCGGLLDELTFFKNLGGAVPSFAAGQKIRSAEGVIRMDLCMIEPVTADWNHDGFPDLVVAEEDSRVAVLLHSGRVRGGVPEFLPPRYLQQTAHEIKLGALATPCGVDWNGDGREDIIAGNSAGYIVFVENLGGTPTKWAAPRYLEIDGQPVRILAGENGSVQGPGEAKWGYTVLSVADWDHDGRLDIVVNSIWGKVVWFRNIGTRTAPQLAPAQAIEVECAGTPPKPAWHWWNPAPNELVTQWRSSVQVIDLDGDGLNDLVALDVDGYLAFYPRRKVDGTLKLLPPRRIFRVEPGQPSVFDHNHKPVFFPAPWDEQVNELATPGPDGRLAFYGWENEDADGKRTLVVTARLQREPETTPPEIAALGPALRLTGGWGGRSGRRKFVLTDWNGDGKLDLLVNSTNVNFLENVATQPGQFVFRDRGPVDGTRLAGHDTCPTVVDWNGDGVPDLLVGAEDGFLYYLENPRASSTQPAP